MEEVENLDDLICRRVVGYANMAFGCEIALKVSAHQTKWDIKVFHK